MKKTITILLTAILTLSITTAAFAASPSVTYEGGAEKFVFLPGSEYTDTDLFDDGFKGVMPGDVVTEEIAVKNNLSGNYNVRIYMKAVPHDEKENPIHPKVSEKETLATMTDFLSQLSMTVKQKDKVLFDASPDKLDGLRNWVELGTFAKGSGTTLTVELKVPEELGNKYANRYGEVDWAFLAEEIPGDKPITGDSSNLMPYLLLIILCAAVVVVIIAAGRKLKKKEENR